MPAPTVERLTPQAGSDIDFGAVVTNADLENLTGTTPLEPALQC